MVGTTCSSAEPVAPTMRTAPLVALPGTTTCSDLPSAATVTGRATMSPTLPLLSRVAKTMSVEASKPLPDRVMVWPVLADAPAASAGAPLAALAVMPLSAMPKAALVPPAVDTRIGPVGMPAATVRFSRVPLEKTSSPAKRPASSMRCAPASTAIAPSAKPLPANCRL